MLLRDVPFMLDSERSRVIGLTVDSDSCVRGEGLRNGGLAVFGLMAESGSAPRSTGVSFGNLKFCCIPPDSFSGLRTPPDVTVLLDTGLLCRVGAEASLSSVIIGVEGPSTRVEGCTLDWPEVEPMYGLILPLRGIWTLEALP
jgi:hypothetical protein